MGLMKYVFEQARKPKGKFGELFVLSMNRGHDRLTQWGLSHLSIKNKDIILDIGCGGGKTVNRLAAIAAAGKVYGIDYSDASVAAAIRTNKEFISGGHVKILKASVDSLPFLDNMFDIVTAVETCYFWPDIVENLKGIKRVLKPGGTLILINEAYRDEKFEKRNASISRACTFSYYLPSEYKEYFEKAGFSGILIEVIEEKNWISITGKK
jgi:ubiquinone/menaquinone biosynthesis C-methylase UbiE